MNADAGVAHRSTTGAIAENGRVEADRRRFRIGRRNRRPLSRFLAARRAHQWSSQRGELPVQESIRIVLCRGRTSHEQILQGLRQPALLLISRRPLPSGQQRARRNHRLAWPATIGLGVKMPDARMALCVGVGIAGEQVRRDLACKVPLAAGTLERQVDGREVARVVAVARADQERDEIARLDGQVVHRARDHLGCTACDAGGERLPHRTAPQLQRPCDAIAALGVRVLHTALDAQHRRHRALPADSHAQGRRRMHGHAVGLHVAGNSHVPPG